MTCWVAEAPRPALEREQGRAPVLPTSCPILGANWVELLSGSRRGRQQQSRSQCSNYVVGMVMGPQELWRERGSAVLVHDRCPARCSAGIMQQSGVHFVGPHWA